MGCAVGYVYLCVLLVAVWVCKGEVRSCLDGDGNDMGAQCVYTSGGVICPPNYYCPTYTYTETVVYGPVLAEHQCSVEGDASSAAMVVQCPCPPGFYW